MKEELAIRAVTVFKDLFPEHWKHALVEGTETANICYKCHTYFDIGDELANGLCTKPGKPIDINWDNAMKLRDQMCNSLKWDNACYDVWQRVTCKAVTYETFWRNYAKAEHYMEAACIAKELNNGRT